jgi:mono/diheme cytochrome c family protein
MISKNGPALGLYVVLSIALGGIVQSRFAMAGPQEASAKRSVWTGVYTDDQARRGEAQYARNCESCHGADLSGNPVQEVPSLVYDAFLTQWNNRAVKDLYETVRRSMPRDNPGGLNARAYIDVIAYILQANKIPSGTKELTLNAEQLAEIVIEREAATTTKDAK